MKALWQTQDEEHTQGISQQLGENLQRFADLVYHIVDKGNTKALEQSSGITKKIGSGKYQPKDVIEFLRFMHIHLR